MHLPIADVYVNPTLLLATGFSTGVLSGFFGMGGAFILTPALNALGLPMELAIGTGLAQTLGKSVVGVYKHAMLRHVDWVLGLSIGLSAMLGVDWGRSVVAALGRAGAVDTVVSVAYIILLLGLGTAMCLETTRSLQNVGDSSEVSRGKVHTTKIGSWLKTVRLGPRVKLVKSGTGFMPLPVLVCLGVVSGFLSGVLGIGGAFIRVPMYIYILGVSTKIAVGTDLVAVLISTFWGTGIYGAAGKVELGAALTMLAGSSLGTQLGALATEYVPEIKMRLYLALTILLTGVAIVLRELGLLQIGTIVLFALPAVLSSWIVYYLIRQAHYERAVAQLK